MNDEYDQIMPLASTTKLDILLAYDGSLHCQAAVNLLHDLPLTVESTITALTVLPTQHITGHEDLKAKLEQLRRKLTRQGVNVDIDMKAGNPAATINDLAQKIQTDLIVIGAQGLRATLGILLGGVAQQVLEYSCCPVLIVRAPYEGIRKILLLMDGSSYSQRALEYLAPLAGLDRARIPLKPDTQVTVMHVLPPPVTAELVTRSWTVGPEAIFPMPSQTLDFEALEQREAEQGDDLLQAALNNLAQGGIQANSAMPRGDAATEILAYIKEQKIDLVIAGSRGLSRVTGWLLGSVSRKIVHYASCSVLIVKSETPIL